jgi:hypothetical protein
MKSRFNKIQILSIKILVSIFVLFLVSPAFSGTVDTLYYVGNIKISKKTSYSYKLRFVISANNSVTGYSLTDAGGLYETKNKIIGKFDSIANTLYFEEQKVLRSRVDTAKSGLCFIQATLKFKKDKMFETLAGKFIGVEPNKSSPCGSGEIKLINTKKIKKVIDDANKITDKKNTEVIDSKTQSSTSPIKIVDDKPKALLFKESEISLTLWDNGIIDDDKISIIVDGKYVLKNYTLEATKKVVNVKIPDGIDDIKLVILALNEGIEPPNTAMVIIESLSDKYFVEVRAKQNETRTIYLSRRRETK